VEEEVEAVQAIYEGDCTILQRFPPHLSVALKPHTADDPSRQFVEAVLVIKASDQYPGMIPDLELQDTKGLDDKRHAKFLCDLHAKLRQFSPGPMLVAISEAAKELLTSMNAPDGDCCFCMLPLDMPDSSQRSRPYMKLMSCFHCFHRFSVENFVPFLTSWFCVLNVVSYFSCKACDSLLLQSFIIFFLFYKNFVLLHMSFPWSHAFF
jgi:E3 ubiquitin-protein ligase RNF25